MYTQKMRVYHTNFILLIIIIIKCLTRYTISKIQNLQFLKFSFVSRSLALSHFIASILHYIRFFLENPIFLSFTCIQMARSLEEERSL